jgi:hypothetical protein
MDDGISLLHLCYDKKLVSRFEFFWSNMVLEKKVFKELKDFSYRYKLL